MEIGTRDFGKVNIEEEDIIKFKQGLPGFPDLKDYVLLPLGEDSPFIVMQSVDKAELAFITVEPGTMLKDYQFDISQQVKKDLKIESMEDIIVLTIATLKNDINDMTINLAAPVVINIKERLGKQVIVDGNYPVKFQVFSDELEKVAE